MASPRLSSAVDEVLNALKPKADGAAGAATPQLRLQFPDHPEALTTAAVLLNPTKAKHRPALALASSLVADQTGSSQKKYLALSIDPDAPFPSWPVLGPIAHGLYMDLVPTPSTTSSADGWVPLVEVTPAQGAVAPLLDYHPPGPPPPSSAHRYVFLVWEQPEGLDEVKIRKALGWPAEGPIGRTARMRFDEPGFEEKLGLGKVVAANYFLSRSS